MCRIGLLSAAGGRRQQCNKEGQEPRTYARHVGPRIPAFAPNQRATIENPVGEPRPGGARVPRRIARANRGKSVRAMAAKKYRLGVDVGGTHTDLVLLDVASGELRVEKVATTPQNPALAVLDGIANFIRRGVRPDEITFFAHGTTITTNALLEMRGARVGLLITAGYRAVQEIQNQARDGNLFDYFYDKPAPLAPQSLTREIPERCDHLGNVIVPLDRDGVRAAVRAFKAAGVESIAVCYLFSFVNPAHEEETRNLIRAEFPGVPVSLSCEVLPRVR